MGNMCVENHTDELLPCHLNAYFIFVGLIKKFNSVLGRYGFLLIYINLGVLDIIIKGISHVI
tara:strand:+ start:266 stop:451 length:186 start_codon:yes stop_codon:yes gene_type:complete